MQVNLFTKKMTDVEKEMFTDYVNRKVQKIEKFLTEFDDDMVKLDVKAEKFPNKEAYKVEFVMELPKATHLPLCASEDSRDLRKAVDFAESKLIEQMKRALEKLHHQHMRPA